MSGTTGRRLSEQAARAAAITAAEQSWRPPEVPRYRTLLRMPSQLPARFLGTALALAACDLPAATGTSPGARVFLLVVVGCAAWWAAPMTDARPAQYALRRRGIAARRRPTVLAAASVVAAAATDPPTWLAVCVAALFLAYVLITDDWIMGSTAPRAARAPAPLLTAAAASALTFVCATVPVASTSWARLPAALALAATAACLAMVMRGRRTPE
ncbi:hypothetical protein SAMN05216251_103376 [Actinacidiphila alni]|uniref:Uncharacterized protein n=1 Tax=Actinacidiphila alni TaxID=380248 RepID=A0A1I2B6Q0_9ACTN|nr:hypothetical protein [Actinacidiphila alni]SFE51835.1 hypothetical protein SAMN05216251_103376 [Actinacidiphila alni]